MFKPGKNKYKVIDCHTAKEKGLEGIRDDDFYSGLWLFREGETAKLFGSDCAEVEDRTLGRHFSWILEEIENAYLQGLEDGEGDDDC